VIHRYYAGLPHGPLVASSAQASRIEIRPSLLRAIAMGIQPVGLGKGRRDTGLDLRSKGREEREAAGHNRCNRDCAKSFDHDHPLSWAFKARCLAGG
jgi:hypothetical protein